jgi:hypothetical protein
VEIVRALLSLRIPKVSTFENLGLEGRQCAETRDAVRLLHQRFLTKKYELQNADPNTVIFDAVVDYA